MGVLPNKIGRDELKAGDHIYSWRQAYLYAHHGIYIGEEKVIHFTRGAGQEIGTGTVLDRIVTCCDALYSPDNPCPICGHHSRLEGVISSCIDCFLSGGDLYRFEYSISTAVFLARPRGGTCTLAASDPPEDVLHRASVLLENGFGVYHIFRNNCEDFAIYCKTGLLVFANISVGRIGQAASFLTTGFGVISAIPFVSPRLRFLATGFGGLAATGFGGLAAVGGIYCVSRLISDIGVRRDVKKIPVELLVAL